MTIMIDIFIYAAFLFKSNPEKLTSGYSLFIISAIAGDIFRSPVFMREIIPSVSPKNFPALDWLPIRVINFINSVFIFLTYMSCLYHTPLFDYMTSNDLELTYTHSTMFKVSI